MDRSSSTLHYPDVVSQPASSSMTSFKIKIIEISFSLADSKQAASNYAAGLKMAR
jgi:hypothetical protein